MPPTAPPAVAGTLPAPRRTWSDLWFDTRNRWLGNPAFRRWAASFWPTRHLARRRASDLFDLVAGFVYSQVLLACVRLDLFAVLADGARPLAEIAHRIGLPEAGAARLLAAAAALDLVEKRPDGGYGLGTLGACLRGNDGVLAMVEHHAQLYADLRDPVALLAGTGAPTSPSHLGRYWPYAATAAPETLTPDAVRPYSALMSASQPLVAHDILDAYPVGHHRCVLDVGGGEGTFLLHAGARAPHLQLVLADLPAVAASAKARFEAAGVAHRASTWGGDFFQQALPAGADLATLVRVVHDHDDANVMRLLRAVRQALVPGGTVLLAEPMAGTPGAERMGDAYFGFYLLAMGSGRPRPLAELLRMVEAAGFVDVRHIPTRMPMQTSLISGKTPVNLN